MSLVLSAADLWVEDLEDLLGLDPVQRPGLGTDHRRPKKRSLAFWGPIYVAALAVGVTVVFVELNGRGSSNGGGQASVEAARSSGTDLPLAPSSQPSRTAAVSGPIRPGDGPDTRDGLASNDALTRRDPDDGVAHPRTAGSERSTTIPSRQPKAQAVASEPAQPGSRLRPTLPVEREATIGDDTGNLPPAPGYFSGETSRLARTTSGSGGGKDAQPTSVRLADDRPTPAAVTSSRPTSPSIQGSPQDRSSDDGFAKEASTTRRSNAGRKTRMTDTEAIDALRTLRRQ